MSVDGPIIYRKISNGLLCFKALLGLVVYLNLFRQRNFQLGSTWSGILKGIYIPCLLDWLNYTLYIFGLGSNFSFFSSVKPLVTIISWLLIAHALRSYDPPKSGGSNGIGSDKMHELVDRAASAARRIA
ncbi:MAG TPA: hypothetical protein VLV83_04570 [Acidobacteriota bacterium]|nr:hypothetical protein [Acidobacteriota bacterium]